MKFILGEKRDMTQKFTEDGNVIPVTGVAVGPCVITQIKTVSNDGYSAVQIGFGTKKHINKPLSGHFKKLGNFRYVKEFIIKPEEENNFKVGDQITFQIFSAGDKVEVVGVSKGKGFQGVVKRHDFAGHPATHGHKDQLRMTGTIGAGGMQHVMKGKKMPGRMGTDQVTVKNLQIIEIDKDTKTLFIKGAIPGRRGSLIIVSGEGQMNLEAPAAAEVKPEVSAEAKINQEAQMPAAEVKPAQAEAPVNKVEAEVKQ